MSPIKKKKLISLRKKLDVLDNTLIKIIKKRTNLVDQVLNLKDFKKQIVDKKRIKQILSRIKKKSKEKKIDTQITQEVWKSMISACIKYEYRNFKK